MTELTTSDFLHENARIISSRHDALDPVGKIAMRLNSGDEQSNPSLENAHFCPPQHMHLHALFRASSRRKRHHISQAFDDWIASRCRLDKSKMISFKHECFFSISTGALTVLC